MDRLVALRLLCRSVTARNAVTKQNFHASVRQLSAKDASSSSDSSDSSDSDNEKPKKTAKRVVFKETRDETDKQQTVNLLNDLLAKMNGDKLITKPVDIAIPPKKPKKKLKPKTLEEKLTDAAKEVAKTLGGDVQKREDELLEKIFSAGTSGPQAPISIPEKPTKKQKKQKKQKTAAAAAAQEKPEVKLEEKPEVKLEEKPEVKLEEKPEVKTEAKPEVKSEAKPEVKSEEKPKVKLEKLLKMEKPKAKPIETQPEPSLSELLSGMKIDRTPQKVIEDDGLTISRSEKVRELAEKFNGRQRTGQRPFAQMQKESPGGLYAGRPFGILGKIEGTEQTISLDTWRELEKQELKMLVVHPPENYFEELIQWTEKGILWKFPIDNEQGMEAEQSVHFSEHVFLEKHLAPWCPKKGPLRHFMELVCVGLSKNPYLTVEEKKEHIFWYRDYFGDKQTLLKEIGVLDKEILAEGGSEKQIEG